MFGRPLPALKVCGCVRNTLYINYQVIKTIWNILEANKENIGFKKIILSAKKSITDKPIRASQICHIQYISVSTSHFRFLDQTLR